MRFWIIVACGVLSLNACTKKKSSAAAAATGCFSHFGTNSEWSTPVEVTINGYTANSMEPKVSSDQVVLFWNDKPTSDDQMNLHYAIKDGSGVYQYIGTLTGTVNTTYLDGVPAIDVNGQFYFVSTRTYATNMRTLYGGQVQVLSASSLQINSVAAADTAVSAGVNGTLDMDLDVSWDGNLAVVSRAVFAGNASYPESSTLKLFGVSSRALSARGDSDSIFANVNFSDCRVYAGTFSRDLLEVYFTVIPTGSSPSSADFRVAVAKRSSLTDVFSNPQILAAISGAVTEGPATTYDDSSKTLFFHRFDSVSGRYKIYKTTRS